MKRVYEPPEMDILFLRGDVMSASGPLTSVNDFPEDEEETRWGELYG